MNDISRRESDRDIFKMLGEYGQALKSIDKRIDLTDGHIADMAECLKECQMVNIINEQKEMRIQIKWIRRIGLGIVSVFGMAIFFLLMGHPVIFQKLVDKIYK